MVDGGLLLYGKDSSVAQERSETRIWKTRIKEVVQAEQVTIVLKLRSKKYKTITRERGILTRLIQQLVTPQRE